MIAAVGGLAGRPAADRRVAGRADGLVPAPELSVIVPTLNEADNIPLLYRALCDALAGTRWEMIVVDDGSTDGTVAVVNDIASHDSRVRCLRRLRRRGLAGAVTEGMLASSAFAVAVIDADLQHDEVVLPLMLSSLREGADLAIGTRRAAGGRANGGFSSWRRWASDSATHAARLLLGVRVSDPMSGFFMIRRDVAERLAPRLSSQGFKVLLDLLVSAEAPLRVVEHAYAFRPRRHGRSKLDTAVVWDYLGLLVAKATGDRVSARFLSFALVGLTGLAVHLVLLNALLASTPLPFDGAQFAAAFGAMTWNFVLNNAFTYADRRLEGRDWVRGLLSFYAVCSIGAVANVGVASWVYGNEPVWWIAGAAGAVMGAVFNYSVNTAFTWRKV